MEEKKIRRDGKIGCPPLGIGVSSVVLDRPVTWPVVVEVLAPEQELNGVPASGDVLFATLLVERNQERRVDYGDRFRVVDDTGLRIPVHVVYVGLIQGPVVDQLLWAVLFIVYGSFVETIDLGYAVVALGPKPGVFGGV